MRVSVLLSTSLVLLGAVGVLNVPMLASEITFASASSPAVVIGAKPVESMSAQELDNEIKEINRLGPFGKLKYKARLAQLEAAFDALSSSAGAPDQTASKVPSSSVTVSAPVLPMPSPAVVIGAKPVESMSAQELDNEIKEINSLGPFGKLKYKARLAQLQTAPGVPTLPNSGTQVTTSAPTLPGVTPPSVQPPFRIHESPAVIVSPSAPPPPPPPPIARTSPGTPSDGLGVPPSPIARTSPVAPPPPPPVTTATSSVPRFNPSDLMAGRSTLRSPGGSGATIGSSASSSSTLPPPPLPMDTPAVPSSTVPSPNPVAPQHIIPPSVLEAQRGALAPGQLPPERVRPTIEKSSYEERVIRDARGNPLTFPQACDVPEAHKVGILGHHTYNDEITASPELLPLQGHVVPFGAKWHFRTFTHIQRDEHGKIIDDGTTGERDYVISDSVGLTGSGRGKNDELLLTQTIPGQAVTAHVDHKGGYVYCLSKPYQAIIHGAKAVPHVAPGGASSRSSPNAASSSQ